MLFLRKLLFGSLFFSTFLTLRAAENIVVPAADARRLEILFLGAPTANGPNHDPITRYRVLKKALGVEGINLTYSENLAEAFDPDFLGEFDALLLYGNWRTLEAAREESLLDYVAEGHGFLPIHCASACFGNSDAFISLVGARFRRHDGGVFAPKTINADHPIMVGLTPVEAWDETYVHDRHNEDRTVLQLREDPKGDEPWTWVRTYGDGRIFYTASGHDHRVWDLPEFHALLRNAIYWAVGDEARARLTALNLPELPQQEVLLPGYRRREAITRAQVPLSPKDSSKLIQVPVGFEATLFAAEPDIVNPIYVGWDHRGRAYVVETIDYPNNLQEGNIGHDRITICEDTDGDGRADKFTVFADKLSIPTSLVFANGGVICTNGTELLFLQDTDGDDRTDVREVLIDGFIPRDTHAGTSNLKYGFDNWIYATIGYSGYEGEVGGVHHEFAQGLFRFRADGSELEYLQPTTNNTWGLGFTASFDILGSTANGNPSWVYTLPAERFENFGLTAPRTPRADDNPLFFPSSMDIRQVDVHDGYTAAAGHAFYTADRFPDEYHDRIAFITEPTGKLVAEFTIERSGAIFTARQRPNNLFNSADAWSSPVSAEVGPDGAVWVCDWYNLIVQHNPTPSVSSAGMDAERGPGNAYVSPLRDKQHGRIWRVYPRDTNPADEPVLNATDAAALVSALDHPNLLWRLHAQRLLVEGEHDAVAAELRRVALGQGRGAVHAFQALAGLGLVDNDIVAESLDSQQFGVRRAAREIASRQFPGLIRGQFLTSASGSVPGDNARENLEWLAAVSRVDAHSEIGHRLFAFLEAHQADLLPDPVMMDAWQVAARSHVAGVLEQAVASDLSLENADTGLAGPILQIVAWVSSAVPEQLEQLVASARGQDNAFAHYVLAGLTADSMNPARSERRFLPDPEIHRRGAQIYANTCVACHGLDGRGVAGAFPPLAGSSWLTGDPSIPIRVVSHGLSGPIEVDGATFNSLMPPVAGLSQRDVADVITYVRQNFGNDASPVSEDMVRAVRRSGGRRREMWTAEELMPTAQQN